MLVGKSRKEKSEVEEEQVSTMEPPEVSKNMIFVSSTTALNSLVMGAGQLLTLKDRVQMGNLKFESLCHVLSSTLQEISLRLIKLTEEDKDLREQALGCRRVLLETASNILLNANHPYKTFPYLEKVPDICSASLELNEHFLVRSLVALSKPVLESMEALEKSSGYKNFFINLKLFGSKLHSFMEEVSLRTRDLGSELTANDLIMESDTVKKLLPVLIQSMQESLKHPVNCHTRTNREYFFNVMRKSLNRIPEIFKGHHKARSAFNEISSDVGKFLRSLDLIVDTCDRDSHDNKLFTLEDVLSVDKEIEWLVKFALAVAKVSPSSEEEEIISTCQHVLSQISLLRREVEEVSDHAAVARARLAVRESAELLEQVVNNVLLKLIIDVFCNIDSPLDLLIHQILNSNISPPDRMPHDVDDLVSKVDERADLLFHIAHFTKFCTNDKVRSQAIKTSLHLMQELESELVPASLKLYFNPEDHGARFHLSAVRSLWMQEIAILEENILEIVDATAFCYVANQEARMVAAQIKKEQYSQDRSWITHHGLRLIRMCQRVVDFAWKDTSRPEEALPDDHPIVKVERSTWEVQGALRLVLNNIEDLNLHKTMIRRIQVLVTCLGTVANFLLSKNETTSLSVSKVRVLTSVSRISIGHDNKMTVITEGQNISNTPRTPVSRSKAMSFRSVQKNKNMLKRHRCEGDVDKRVEESVIKLAAQSSNTLPFHTRKMTKSLMNIGGEEEEDRAKGELESKTIATGLDFTELFDELSALSREITESLAQDEVEEYVELKDIAKDISLRKMAFKNNNAALARTAVDVGEAEKLSKLEMTSNIGIASPERLRDIRTLDAKLAAIRSDLEGTELK